MKVSPELAELAFRCSDFEPCVTDVETSAFVLADSEPCVFSVHFVPSASSKSTWLAMIPLIGKLLPPWWSVRKISLYPFTFAASAMIPTSESASLLTTPCTCVSVLNHCQPSEPDAAGGPDHSARNGSDRTASASRHVRSCTRRNLVRAVTRSAPTRRPRPPMPRTQRRHL